MFGGLAGKVAIVTGGAGGLRGAAARRSGGAAQGGRDDMRQRAATSPLRRAGTPAEIASVVAFLLSDESA